MVADHIDIVNAASLVDEADADVKALVISMEFVVAPGVIGVVVASLVEVEIVTGSAQENRMGP